MSYSCSHKCRMFVMSDPKMLRKNCIEEKIRNSISCKKREVFLRVDFQDISSDYDQVGRALRKLVAKGFLIKIGYGLYAKAAPSPFSGRSVSRIGIKELGIQCLKRFHVEFGLTIAEKEYNEGLSTQVPTGRVIAIKGRFTRKINVNGTPIVFERLTNPSPQADIC